ncbi:MULTISPECIES: TetR family transcriptional regulator C-terminal domain-containing protein [Marivita]|uniref:TetR family transcriptional regulator C-terminal domain-containing protein n=1 Tax=Marivita cryptomonadis TaxID=505252 RepID=A0A9Q2NU62_9RHOB|nr:MULTISPECIES: TetR family transcriptional regulator C-terminal domain-containing protein [Marivita]MCR9166927.1 TetR family transcriptional regulator C-terminal domain-containing protein [Paracoccaceae bacterium]MBM2322932.1 TetR family transcriptional regulator C-terminal domain-containing protein [Marivita cryptomonadis]MBM2332516.1 TetR family transcriptional regulator C-terminal domain-containing protein [Marivita cryptomonadis]MBM2342099.1 TetR family transcriptional regulator C-termina
MRETPVSPPERKPSRIQTENRQRIRDAALGLFATQGFRGTTLDQIADACGMHKPNLIYYYESKEAIHIDLLNTLMEEWLSPLGAMDPGGDPLEEILGYIHRKMEMSRLYPRESRLFANEIVQGAPRMLPHLESTLKPLFDSQCGIIAKWIKDGKIADLHPAHLIFSIWAVTQHYADFEAQIAVLLPGDDKRARGADQFVEVMFRKVLTP